MRIGIDCRTLLDPENGEGAGIGHYTTYLVDELIRRYRKDTFVLFGDKRTSRLATMRQWQKLANVELVQFPWYKYKKYLPFGYAHVVVAKVVKRAKVDVFHAPAYITPLGYKLPSVVTIHDLAIYKNSVWFPTGQGFSTRIAVPSSLKRAQKIIAVSTATAAMLRQYFKVPAEKIVVIYEGCVKSPRVATARVASVLKKYNIRGRFIFFVGTLEPRKNIVALVKAFDNFIDQSYPKNSDLQLVIAGGKGWKYQQIFQAILRAKWSANIRVVGYVSTEGKSALLQECLFFAFPSLWEGFGLPVLEAARMGAPILTSNVSALPEVAGRGALYVNPRRIGDLQKGIALLVGSAARRRALSKYAREQARQFTWQKCGRQTYEVYKEINSKSQNPKF